MTNKEREVIKEAAKIIAKEVSEGCRVTIQGFGTFSEVTKKARTCRNPKTDEPVEVPAKTTVKFKPSPALSR